MRSVVLAVGAVVCFGGGASGEGSVSSDSAVRSMIRAIEADPTDVSTRLRLGRHLLATGRPAEAERWLTEAESLGLNPGAWNAANGGSTAGTTCGGVAGPDVIVGALPNLTRWGKVGDVTAFSVGTTSCNIGTERLDWFASTNRHPVIAQNAYKLADGRLTQIGMSWLKHGFFALSQNECCECNDPTGGTELGVGCSDPYSSSLNGDQPNLGPRYQVNATTGVFPFPVIPEIPPPQATIGRRLQVHDADLDPALNDGARYFVEGHYITQDEPPLGNDDNNASYREATRITLAGGAWHLIVAGLTIRERAGVYAWADNDPAVTTVEQHDAEGGLFIVASKAVDLGKGVWRYEYAVYNMNSRLAAGSFGVVVGSASIANIGFHDVDHHSGDGIGGVTQSGADWTPQLSGDTLTWATESQQANPNANALRWSTMYNFWFDADAPPNSSGSVIIGYFEPTAGPGGDSLVVAGVVAPTVTPCAGDLDGDGAVGGADLAILLGAWGVCRPGAPCPADLNVSGEVDGADLAVLLGAWGDCSG